jgi:hemerythrin-like domain-containing protein
MTASKSATGKSATGKSTGKPGPKPMLKSTAKAPPKSTVKSHLLVKDPAAQYSPDAIGLLMADHDKIQDLFRQFCRTGSQERKLRLAMAICRELTVHMAIEEQIFYPAVRQVIDDDGSVDEATVEHATAKELILQIEDGEPGEDLWDAKVTVLRAYINRHIVEEQTELFPAVAQSDVDLHALADELAARKAELAARYYQREDAEEALQSEETDDAEQSRSMAFMDLDEADEDLEEPEEVPSTRARYH